MKTSKPKKTKKPKKVAVFYPLNGLNFEDINNQILEKNSIDIEEIKHKFEDGLNGLYGILTGKEKPGRKKKTRKKSINCYLRQMIGYYLFGTSGVKIGLISREAFNTKTGYTYDHFFGCLCVGHIVLKIFIESGYNVDYMVNEWLPKNLYLWMGIRVTKKEHSAITKKAKEFSNKEYPNLDYTQKRNMEHYKEISDIGFLVKE